jgi:putative phosphoribosyl transferase
MLTTHAPRIVTVPCPGATLYAELAWPITPGRVHGLAVIAHANSGSRLNPRNQALAAMLNRAGLATLLTDLLIPDEDQWEASAAIKRYDVDLLTSRIRGVVERLAHLEIETAALPVAVLGTGTAAAAAIGAAAELGATTEDPLVDGRPRPPRAPHIDAIVCRTGRPDLAGKPPGDVPMLSLVAEHDQEARALHRDVPGEVRIVPGATDLVEDPHAVEAAALTAAVWLVSRLDPGQDGADPIEGDRIRHA